MLNNGPHVCAVVSVFDDIPQRKQTQLVKKKATFRSLERANSFLSKDNVACSGDV